jgi:O-6-methylguanine DNA methyltransferase
MATKLQEKVWAALHRIPKGKVTTYGTLSKFLKTKAVRAVGTAVGKNPNAPACPCHRVVRADGKIGQYSGKGGIAGKIALLKKEGIVVEKGRVDMGTYSYNLLSPSSSSSK